MCRPCQRQDQLDRRRQRPDTAHDRTARHHATEIKQTGNALTDHSPTRPVLIAAFALVIGALASASPAWSQSAISEGQKLAFDRSKGNCLTCHVIKGGDLPGSIGPELKDIKSKYPDRNDLVAIITDETKRNPQ